MADTAVEIVKPDAEGFLPNGWVDPYPHNDFEHPCYLQCCEPEAYPEPNVWRCQNPNCSQTNGGYYPAKLRQPGECINCCPPQTAQSTT